MKKEKGTGAQKPPELEMKILRRAKCSLDVLRMWGGDKGKHVNSYIIESNLLNDDLFKRFLSCVHYFGEALGPDEAERYFAECPDNRMRRGRFLDFDAFNNILVEAYSHFIGSLTREEVDRLNSIIRPDEVGSFLFEFLDTVTTLARAERISGKRN